MDVSYFTKKFKFLSTWKIEKLYSILLLSTCDSVEEFASACPVTFLLEEEKFLLEEANFLLGEEKFLLEDEKFLLEEEKLSTFL